MIPCWGGIGMRVIYGLSFVVCVGPCQECFFFGGGGLSAGAFVAGEPTFTGGIWVLRCTVCAHVFTFVVLMDRVSFRPWLSSWLCCEHQAHLWRLCSVSGSWTRTRNPMTIKHFICTTLNNASYRRYYGCASLSSCRVLVYNLLNCTV